jgi:SagB-type dehydrogenase family enzyme
VGVERLLRLFDDWRDVDAVDALAPDPDDDARARWRALASQLIDAGILVAEGSPRADRENALLHGWRHWSPLARALTFGTRIGRDATTVTPEGEAARLDAKLAREAPPPAFTVVPGAPRIHLPRVPLPDVAFADVLHARRSHRVYGGAAVPLDTVAALLLAVGGRAPGYAEAALDAHQTVFKTSPSAGGRHPTEVYPLIRDVDGIPPGVYHYHSPDHSLERLADPPARPEVVRLCADQEWTGDASLLLLYTSRFGRSMWKYDATRTYRNLLLDAGHLSQTVYLVATALGLRTTFTAAVRDELVEDLLGLDLAEEFVIGCAALGT